MFAFHEDGIGQSVPIILASTVELCVPEGSEETYRNALYSDTNLGWTCPEGWGSFSTLYAGVKVVHVTDPRDLEIVRQIVNNGGKYNFYSAIYLDADLDMAGYKWDWGIGDQEEHPFTGNFYGNGHTIKNLSVINKNATTGEYQGPAGLFSFFGGNIVSNVIFEGCHFEGKTAVGAFAGISGRCSYNTIWVQECTFSVHDGHIGGILGECITTGGANLNQCVVASPNFSESMSTPDEQESVHGCIVGYCYGAYINNCAVWGNTRIVYNKTTSREQWTCNPFVGECNNIDIVQIKNSYNADFRYENYTPASNIEYTNVVLEKHTPISIKTFPDDIVVNTTISGQLFYSLFMIPTLGLDNWVFQQGYFPMPVSFESRMPILVNRAEYRPASLTTPRLNGLSFANATSWSCFYDLSETGYRSMTYRANRLWIDDTFPYNLKQSPSGEPSYYLPLGSATIKVSDGVKYDRTLEVTENGTNPFTATKVKTDENGAPILDEYGNYIPDGEITLFEQTAYTPTGYVVYLPYRLNNNKTFRLFEPSDVTINGGEAFLDMAEIDDEIINPWTPY